MREVMKAACMACPYRKDVASGVWAAEEYDKLPPYDAPTYAQPMAVFSCHEDPTKLCHGWAVCHSNRGGEFELLALRIQGPGLDAIPKPSTELFNSGTEAAEHGKRLINRPNKKAQVTVARLLAKHPRLLDGMEE